ncbi:hypothetical protein Trco_007826 [Trichoderma cornu-damae]|uniref:UBZ4-type domain-containing protein n=1 Tax=Trichoderma cornu-damae TaxID=654480 RepID=A0A9P8QJV0_9HYPO|nr:hypothetical protein Trco_007826 [Trichoderma cornu-damae]
MNRPRNRQPRSSSQNQSRGGKSSNLGRRAPGTSQQAAGTVPKARQVVPGASVFIILKQDQSTGRETQGIVQDVLTSGDHPRGIKVRLRSGQIGRVQRLDDGSSSAEPSSGTALASNASGPRSDRRYTDIRNDENFEQYLQGPPARSLADFMPALDLPAANATAGSAGDALTNEATVVCPMCEAFEGDEAAVTHHLDREHFS